MSMKKLILDRLIDTIQQAADEKHRETASQMAQMGKMTADLRIEFARANQRLTAVTKELAELRSRYAEASLSLAELYRAAEGMQQAKSLKQVNAARQLLSLALTVAKKQIDFIPF